MASIARERGERAEHERIAHQVGPRKHEAGLVHDRRTVQQQIQVERSGTVARARTIASALILHGVERLADGARRRVRIEGDDEVVEIVAFEADGRVAEHGRDAQGTEAVRHLLQAPAQVAHGIDGAFANLGRTEAHSHAFAEAILTTDTKRKSAATRLKIGRETITIAGRTGVQVEISSTLKTADCPTSVLWTTPNGTSMDAYPMISDLDLEGGYPAKYDIVDVDGTLIAIMTPTLTQTSPFEEQQGIARDPERHAADAVEMQAILDSIEMSSP